MSFSYTLTETAALLKVKPSTVRIYTRQGLKGFSGASGRLMFELTEIQRFSKERKGK
jgi:hypothetical protein